MQGLELELETRAGIIKREIHFQIEFFCCVPPFSWSLSGGLGSYSLIFCFLIFSTVLLHLCVCMSFSIYFLLGKVVTRNSKQSSRQEGKGQRTKWEMKKENEKEKKKKKWMMEAHICLVYILTTPCPSFSHSSHKSHTRPTKMSLRVSNCCALYCSHSLSST